MRIALTKYPFLQDIPSDLNHNEQFKGNSRDGETEPYLHNDSETALNFSLIKRKQDWDEEQIEMLRWLVKHGYDAATAKVTTKSYFFFLLIYLLFLCTHLLTCQ